MATPPTQAKQRFLDSVLMSFAPLRAAYRRNTQSTPTLSQYIVNLAENPAAQSAQGNGQRPPLPPYTEREDNARRRLRTILCNNIVNLDSKNAISRIEDIVWEMKKNLDETLSQLSPEDAARGKEYKKKIEELEVERGKIPTTFENEEMAISLDEMMKIASDNHNYWDEQGQSPDITYELHVESYKRANHYRDLKKCLVSIEEARMEQSEDVLEILKDWEAKKDMVDEDPIMKELSIQVIRAINDFRNKTTDLRKQWETANSSTSLDCQLYKTAAYSFLTMEVSKSEILSKTALQILRSKSDVMQLKKTESQLDAVNTVLEKIREVNGFTETTKELLDNTVETDTVFQPSTSGTSASSEESSED